MKRKGNDYAAWFGVGEQQVIKVPGGSIVDYRPGMVETPLDVTILGQTVRVLASGYRWVDFIPTAGHHALKVQMNEWGVPLQLYVDVFRESGIDGNGVPWINDLYLDVVALCEVRLDGEWHVTKAEIIDADELEDALAEGRVSQGDAELSWEQARVAEAALREQNFALVEVIRQYVRGAST
ncbi:DUF402 domain-containing protein [Deinococcus phoenicis]|uniref:DUF402 domain-containing protein n=1 Tax=Deinococcus phoenicis TaxID=1476583 RepID=UPI000687D5BD|nr:DUF402 domain-containing protein [Deinococcus phoenicis]